MILCRNLKKKKYYVNGLNKIILCRLRNFVSDLYDVLPCHLAPFYYIREGKKNREKPILFFNKVRYFKCIKIIFFFFGLYGSYYKVIVE